MSVTVLLPGVLRPYAGDEARVGVDVDAGTTLGDVLGILAGRYPRLDRRLRDEQGTLRRHVNFYVDGEECRRLAGAATAVPDGVEIQIIPSIAGG